MYERIEAAFESETHSFKQSLLYNTHSTGRRRGATTSFQLGLRDGICGKLSQLKQARATSTRQTSGRDLVPVKKALIDTEFAALGLTLRRAGTRGNRVLPQAYEVGKRSGERLEWEDRIRE